MEEKQQKKIKASPRPGKLAGYLTNFLASVGLAGMSTNRYQANFPASEEASVRPTDRCTFARLTCIITQRMRLCIAEKPSVALEIARVLGANTRRDGFYEGNGYVVSWTYGHLCTLKDPGDYTPAWKRWDMRCLPMIPPRFGIKLIEEEHCMRQFRVLEALIAKADEVINCGDAGQEGELIQRWVMQKARCQCPVKRLWISSLTEEAIREGFHRLKDASAYQRLYEAGLARAIGDWLLGMNATRLYSLRFGGPGRVLSIGRVQTPTLALIVRRQREIEAFRPEPYWELKTVYRDVTFTASRGRFAKKEEGEALLRAIEGQPFTVTDVTKKKGREAPPKLFDLTSLQVECNRRFSLSAEDTLRLIQSLYEKKVTTYPRVDTTYLSEDLHPKVSGILKGMTDYAALTSPLTAAPIPKNKRVFDNKKVTDHHAIIPTGTAAPAGLSADERRVYDLVARRFIAAFYPDCEVSTTTVTGASAEVDFRATGRQILKPGWRTVFEREGSKKEEKAEEEEAEAVLPAFRKGESGPHQPSLVEKQTTPPKPYTEATLLRAMETAGRFVDDEALRELMKENGIGRPSTRANIIKTLLKRDYIRRERKHLVATPTGVSLIDTIHEELLKSPELTGQWERKLRGIEQGSYEASAFLTELKEMVARIVR